MIHDVEELDLDVYVVIISSMVYAHDGDLCCAQVSEARGGLEELRPRGCEEASKWLSERVI